ncbi:hypothetical protein BUALT_Bualt12G0065900 [Buddleja alternifolia]|uniref:Clp R domain-containing protein n=1 Tax=Buddleja alternifolia TaxID=168488 RepID=A0AAV6WWG1_9LAMI|nr:hypothetical protein BUALT_Bualt12G0065900 [Buddleja alternifolia]
MRAGLSTIQQTLTPEAATVLNHSISEAGRRNHGQTTPLHVAATLLSSPSGYLRQACIRSHPNSSHPLQCRALELCFSVALERLPTAQATPTEPPISNALMAALKRAQAHQRRGCPEQQQQPLLAVKVELEQLIISILDDPSVSRVMREASFSSPAVKAAIEQSLNTPNPQTHHHVSFGPRMVSSPAQLAAASSPAQLANRNMYLNPRLQQGSIAPQTGNQRGEEVKKVLEILLRDKKRNPVLVGDLEPEALLKEILSKIERNELGNDAVLRNVRVLSMDKGLLSDRNEIASKIEELGGLIESRIGNGGVIVDLGDLKWLVEQPVSSLTGGVQLHQKQEMGRSAVVEMAKLLARFNGGENKVWLIGTATCETYLRCQVYHSTMENDWDLQAMPIASRSPLPGMFPRLGTERLLSSPLESFNTLKAVPTPLPALTRRLSEDSDSNQNSTFCPRCSENYEKELARLAAIEKSFSESKQEANRPSLPQWLQNAKQTTDQSQENKQGLLSEQKTQELQKKWRDTCLHLHPNFHQDTRPVKTGPLQTGPRPLSMPSLFNPNLLSRPPFQPKLQTNKPLGEALQLNTTPVLGRPVERPNNPPGSPVRTELVLGRKETDSIHEKVSEDQAKDFLGCISSEPQTKLSEPQIKLLDKFANALDADTYKKLLKGLMEKAWWQAEASVEVASAITRCRLGNGKRRGGGLRGDIWLLFTGPDRVGKKKMAYVLADQVCGANPIMICLGTRRDDEESDVSLNFRGKTAIDRIAEAVRRNPFSVIMLEDIDEADIVVRGSIKRAMERGRLTDSHGREVGLGNAVFIVTGDWSTTNHERDGHYLDEKKLASIASGGWQLGLIVREKSSKRRANWLQDRDRQLKTRKETEPGLSLDLNLAVGDTEDDKNDTSYNSSDLTVDHEDDLALVNRQFSITLVPHELVSNVDDSIVFKPVDPAFVRREIKKTISVKFSMVVDDNMSIEIDDDVLEKILGGLWHDRTSLEEWMEKVLAPSFEQLKSRLPAGDRSSSVVRLVVESGFGDRGKSKGNADWLPSCIMV